MLNKDSDLFSSSKRQILGAGLVSLLSPGELTMKAWAAPISTNHADVEAALRMGGVVIAFRHAIAPGTFDPPGFVLGDCATQRNLSEQGRAQALRIGAWFKARSLQPSRIRNSPWCRCADTARLAFGVQESWAALASPQGATETTNQAALKELRKSVSAVKQLNKGGFEVWVTHMFVLSDLVQTPTASGEGLVLQADDKGDVRVLARLTVDA
jgi:phosphohistidine phosphatase SixA